MVVLECWERPLIPFATVLVSDIWELPDCSFPSGLHSSLYCCCDIKNIDSQTSSSFLGDDCLVILRCEQPHLFSGFLVGGKGFWSLSHIIGKHVSLPYLEAETCKSGSKFKRSFISIIGKCAFVSLRSRFWEYCYIWYKL